MNSTGKKFDKTPRKGLVYSCLQEKVNTMKKILFITALIFTTIINANPFAKPSEPSGVLNLGTLHTTKDIFPVVINQIDGQNVVNRNNAVWLKPGKHSIKVSAIVDLSHRSHGITHKQKGFNQKNRDLEINVENGKMYYIGYDTSDSNPNNWKPIVWKVK